MPAPGTKPKPGGKHGHNVSAVSWTEVPNVAFVGEHPELPDTRPVEWMTWEDKKQVRHVEDQPLKPETLAWWEAMSSMPHCVLWSMSDWVFAIATALIADMVFCGDRQAAGELRQREKIMGATLDSRRDLRIRYVDPPSDDVESSAPVVNLNTRRARLTAG